MAEPPLSILMVSDFYPPHLGGQERVVADLSAELAGRGHRVRVATLWHEGLARRERQGAVIVHRLASTAGRLPFLHTQADRPFHPPIADPWVTYQVGKLIARYRPDVVHGHSWMFASVLPLRRRYRFATVMTLHDYSLLCPKKTLLYHGQSACRYQLSVHCPACAGEQYGAAKSVVVTAGLWAGRRAYRRVDVFTAISDYIAKQHAQALGLSWYDDQGAAEAGPSGNTGHQEGIQPVPRRTGGGQDARAPSHPAAHTGAGEDARAPRRGGPRLLTIPNFVSSRFLAAPPAPPLPDLPADYLLFVGALGKHKGLEVLLAAYARLRTTVPLVLIGLPQPDTPTALPPGVIVVPGLEHGGIMRALDHCRFLVVPSIWPEGFGMVALEAMARGKAVIASALGGLPEVVEHEQTGLLTAPGNREALARAMQTLLDDPGRAEALGRSGAARCTAAFSAGPAVTAMERAYRQARELAGSPWR